MSNKLVRVADYIAQRCVEAGAKHVFLVTGGGAMHLNDAFGRNKKLEPVCFHHEQAAAIAAESYYRLSNRLAVLNVTTGPGGINALNGVYGAYVDSLGMLVISGQVKRETYLKNYPIPLRQLGDQEVDIVSMARPAVKYATVLQDPEQVKKVMDIAVFLATNGRPGPVWVDVPVDVQGALIDPSKLNGFDGSVESLINNIDVSANTKQELKQDPFKKLDKEIEEILQKLKHSKRPVIFVGNGVRISGMHKEFLNMVNILKIPVVTGWNAHDTLTNDNPYYAGKPGTVGDRPGNFSVQNADFLLVLGCRLNIRQVSYNWKSFASKAWVAMVDVDQAELDKPTLNIDLKIVSNLNNFIPQILNYLREYQVNKQHVAYMEWCNERVNKYPTVLPEYKVDQEKINPYAFIEELFAVLDSNDIVITGNGSACVIGFQAAKLKSGQRLYTNSGNASMGYDLPAAIGACLANEKKRIICLAGDGSLMMNIQELQTLVGYDLPIKLIILNNEGYQSIRQTQMTYFSDSLIGLGPSTGVSLPDFVEVGKAFKIKSRKIENLEKINSSLKWITKETTGPAILEVILNINQNFSPKLASRKLKNGTMVSPALEDMAPFLSRKEFNENIFK
jgi:acetolactate synthase I/II/III large subunit